MSSNVVSMAANRPVAKVIIVTADYFPGNLVILSDRQVEVLFMEQADQHDPVDNQQTIPVIKYKDVGYETFSGVVNHAPKNVEDIYAQYAKFNSTMEAGVVEEQIAILEHSIKTANERLNQLLEQKRISDTE